MRKRRTWKVSVSDPRPGDGKNFYLRMYPPHGAVNEHGKPQGERRPSSGTDDREEAERIASNMERDFNALLPITDDDPVFLIVFDRYIALRSAKPNTPENTITAYNYARSTFAPYLDDLPTSRIDQRLLLSIQEELELRPELGNGTINQRFNCLAKAWKWAKKKGLIAPPWPSIEKLVVVETDKRPFTDAEIAVFLEWCREYQGGVWYPLFALLVDTGCRVSEACGLIGSDLDRANSTILIRRAVTKGDRSRAVPVDPEVMALLPDVEPLERVFKPVRPAYRDRPVRPRVVLSVLRRGAKAIVIQDDHRVDVHSFRRSWISTSLRAGVPVPLGMKQMGHTSPTVFFGYQRNTVDDDQREAARRVRERRRSSSSRGRSELREDQRANSKCSLPESQVQTSC